MCGRIDENHTIGGNVESIGSYFGGNLTQLFGRFLLFTGCLEDELIRSDLETADF